VVDQSVDENPEYNDEVRNDEDVGLEDVNPVPPEDVPPDLGDVGRLTREG
jgi:hypothetical protein